MPALVAGIHLLNARPLQKTWMAGNKSGHDGDDACGRCLLADGRALLLQVPRWPAFGAAITAASRRSNPNAYDRAKRCVLGPKIGRFRNQELSPLRSPCRRHHLPLGSRSSGDSWYGGAGSCFDAHSPNNPLAGTIPRAPPTHPWTAAAGSARARCWLGATTIRRVGLRSAFRSGSAVPGAPCRRRTPPGCVWRSEAAGCTRRSRPEPADGVREVGSRSQRDRQRSPAPDRAALGACPSNRFDRF